MPLMEAPGGIMKKKWAKAHIMISTPLAIQKWTKPIPKKVVTESLPLLILKHADKSLLLNCSGVDEWRIHQIQTSA